MKRELRLTVGAAYLCMRAVDEMEDHEQLSNSVKESLLKETQSLLLAEGEFDREQYAELLAPYEAELPEVTVGLADWILVCPEEFAKQ